jgi:hypothetical protein
MFILPEGSLEAIKRRKITFARHQLPALVQ